MLERVETRSLYCPIFSSCLHWHQIKENHKGSACHLMTSWCSAAVKVAGVDCDSVRHSQHSCLACREILLLKKSIPGLLEGIINLGFHAQS